MPFIIKPARTKSVCPGKAFHLPHGRLTHTHVRGRYNSDPGIISRAR